jgi:cytochrome bd-type quinol oxidase subunit 2
MAIAFLTIVFVLPMVWGALSAFFFFIRSQNRKIWAISIAIISFWGICQAIYSLYISVVYMSVVLTKLSVNNIITNPLLEAENQYVRAVLLIAIYILVLYQTYTLYKKRVDAAEIAQEGC